MTRRHFVAIAAVFNELLADDEMERREVLVVIRRLLPVFRWANSSFDTDVFLAACGTSREEVYR